MAYSSKRALIELNIAVLLSALTALFAKIIDLPVNQIILGRSLVAIVALYFFIRLQGGNLRLDSWKSLWFLLGSGFLLGLHWLTYFHSIQLSTVAIGMVSLYTYPVITIILEPFFDRQRHQLTDVFVGFVVFAGVCLMTPEWKLSNQTSLGIFWGVLSALIYSVRNILVRRYVQSIPGTHVMFFQILATILMLLPFMSLNAAQFDPGQIGNLIVLGSVFTALHHTLFARCLKQLKVKTASVIATIQPVLGTALAWGILFERPDVRTVLGGLLVLCAAGWETARHARSVRPDNLPLRT